MWLKSKGLLAIITLLAGCFATEALAINIILPRNTSLLRLPARYEGSRAYCLLTARGPKAATLKRAGRRLVPQRLRKRKIQTRAQNRRIKNLQARCNVLAPRCDPITSDMSFAIKENRDTTIPLSALSGCDAEQLSFEIVSPPANGTVSIEDNSAIYSGSYFEGEDSFTFRSCSRGTPNCGVPSTVYLTVQEGEFSGRSNSLTPYRNQITEFEARYLLKKVGLGGCQALVDHGVNNGLSRMVDTMIDDPRGGCVYPLPLGPEYGYNTTMVRPDNTDPDAFAYWMAHPRHSNIDIAHWRDDLLYRILSVNARYHSPLREYMAWMVWHPNFATYALGSGHLSKLHYNTLSRHALGYVGDYLRDFYGPLQQPTLPSLERVPGVDPLLNYNPDRNAPDGTMIFPESGPYRATGDQLYQTYLNNEQNSVQRPNENLGRELLEVNLAGTHDLVTGEANFQEMDVVASTLSISGLAYDYDGNNNADGIYETNLTVTGPDSAGPWRYWLSFFLPRSLQQSVTIFSGTQYERRARFTTQENVPNTENFLEFLLSSYNPTARRIGAKLFTQLVHQELSEDVVASLASNLRTMRTTIDPRTGMAVQKNFSIAEALRVILKSEAMFSERAMGQGISSPFEMLFSTLRLSDLPFKVWSAVEPIMGELRSAGHLPLAPPNVFGWESFGMPRQGVIHDGSSWLNPNALLAVHRGIMRLASLTMVPTSRPPLIGSIIFPKGTTRCNATDNTECPTAADVVDYVLRRFNLHGNDPKDAMPLISAEERQIFISYLDRPDSPWVGADLGRPNVSQSTGIAVRKGVGLIYLVATHPANFRK